MIGDEPFICNIKRKLIVMLSACMIITSSSPVMATSITDAQRQKVEAEEKLTSVNEEIANIKNQQEELQIQIEELDSELISILTDIEITKIEIADKESDINQRYTDLAVAEAEKEDQYNAMKERICYLYENGDISILNSLLGEDNFAQILNKADNFQELFDYDRDLLDQYMITCQDVEYLIDNIQSEKAELESLENSLEKQQDQLEITKEEKCNELNNFDYQLAEAEELANQYSAAIVEMDNIIALEQQAIIAAQKEAEVQQNKSTLSSTQELNSITCTCNEDNTEETSISLSSTSSNTGQAVADYACQFVGNPYVWGGTSLTNGCDCSGFIMSVYAHFEISLPHSSSALRSVGYEVSSSEIQPGDIICYDGHCAIYIGGGQIVHASNSREGIKISSNYAYRTVLAIRRVF